MTFSCSQPQLVACTFLSSSSSFLSLPSVASATGGFSVRFQFRTWNPNGLLLSVQLNPEPQSLELQISNSRLHLTLHISGRRKSEVSAGKSGTPPHTHAEYTLMKILIQTVFVRTVPNSESRNKYDNSMFCSYYRISRFDIVIVHTSILFTLN